MDYVYRITRSGESVHGKHELLTKVGSRRMVANTAAFIREYNRTERRRAERDGREPRLETFTVERAPVAAFEDITDSFSD